MSAGVQLNEEAVNTFIQTRQIALMKLLGWFGGFGFTGTMNYFTGSLHLPWIIGFLVIIIEFVGSLMLIAGLATRFVAALVIINFIGIIVSTHIPYGFFINWFGNQKGEGYEYHLLIIGMAASLLVSGAGKLSIDKLLTGKLPVN
jgi:putative oxidoreductase